MRRVVEWPLVERDDRAPQRLSQTVPRAAPRRKTGHQRKIVASRGKSSIRLIRNFSEPNLYLTAKNLAVEGRAPRASDAPPRVRSFRIRGFRAARGVGPGARAAVHVRATYATRPLRAESSHSAVSLRTEPRDRAAHSVHEVRAPRPSSSMSSSPFSALTTRHLNHLSLIITVPFLLLLLLLLLVALIATLLDGFSEDLEGVRQARETFRGFVA